MDFSIRNAAREDCPALLKLIHGLAIFERAPDEVTVTIEEFESSGFGEHPVWWAFVAVAPEKEYEERSMTTSLDVQHVAKKDIIEVSQQQSGLPEAFPDIQNAAGLSLLEQNIRLFEAVAPVLPEELEHLQPEPASQGNGKIVGFALYYIRYSTWKGRRMYLEDLYIEEAYRRKGIGTAFMDMLIGRAIAEKLHGISWQVLEWNEPAISFYKRYQPRFDAEWVNVTIDVTNDQS